MNVTFLIGNGFDLNLGLKTKYQDFYKYYHSMPGSDTDMIAKSIESDHKLWSDMETGLGDFLENLKPDGIPEFLDSKKRLDMALAAYLKGQEERVRIRYPNTLAKEFRDRVVSFYREFDPNEQDLYKDFLANESSSIHYSFVTFNYTRVLDFIIKACRNLNFFSSHKFKNLNSCVRTDIIDEPLHIHGTVEDALIVGIDSPEQVKNCVLKTRSDLTDYIVKPTLNAALGKRKVSQFKEIIHNSRYICIFGLSMGDTDQTWWKVLRDWLLENKKNRLVIYIKEDECVSLSATQKSRKDNQERERFKQQSQCGDNLYVQIMKQIIVIHNSDIFKLNNLRVQGEND